MLVCRILLLVLILLHAIVRCHVHPLGSCGILRTMIIIRVILLAGSVICGWTDIIICRSSAHYHIVSFRVQTCFLLIILSGCPATSNVIRWITPLYLVLLFLLLLRLLLNVLLRLIVLVLLHLSLIMRLLLEISIIEALELLIIALSSSCLWHAKPVTEKIVLILSWLLHGGVDLLRYHVIIGEKIHVALLRWRIALECRT